MIEKHREYADRFLGDRFNLFDFLGYDENRLSDVIAKLLDPAAGHGQGATFLSHFLELAAAKANQRAVESPFGQLNQAVLCRENVRVRREHDTPDRRRIDIVISVGQLRFGVENKPRAGDLDKQVSDYVEHLRHSAADRWAFLYLSGDGSPPSDQSLCPTLRRELLESGHYVEWSYGRDLAKWLEQCAPASEADKIRWFLRDFRTYVLREFPLIHNEENENVG